MGSTSYNAQEGPLGNPEANLKTAFANLKTSDWQKCFDGCNTIKRIIWNHKNLLNNSNMTGAVKDLIKSCDSLRSQLSKQALLTVSILFEVYGRQMDP